MDSPGEKRQLNGQSNSSDSFFNAIVKFNNIVGRARRIERGHVTSKSSSSIPNETKYMQPCGMVLVTKSSQRRKGTFSKAWKPFETCCSWLISANRVFKILHLVVRRMIPCNAEEMSRKILDNASARQNIGEFGRYVRNCDG